MPIIGIFGGTFDPIHHGHLEAINLLCEEIAFDMVHWVLSARPPHKNQVSAEIEDRFSMMKLALQDNPLFKADDIEIKRQTKSYTVDTVTSFKQQYPNSHLILIIGADSLNNLPDWHRYEELIEQVNVVVLHRPGYQIDVPEALTKRFVDSPETLKESSGGAIWLFPQSNFNISSTQLRAQLSGFEANFNNLELDLEGIKSDIQSPEPNLVKDFLASDVIEYIRTRQLYKIETMNSEQIKDQVVEALENVKAQDIKVIDIAEISSFADYMVVASGTSDTHVKALARAASDDLRKQGVKPLNEDGADVGEWVLVDFGDVVLHVMRPEVRDYYALEKLWDEDVRRLVEQHREGNED